jgi:hypothetical protein
MERKVAAQDVTWTRWTSTAAANPDVIDAPTAADIGDIAGSGCFFARKFARGSSVGEFHLHR